MEVIKYKNIDSFLKLHIYIVLEGLNDEFDRTLRKYGQSTLIIEMESESDGRYKGEVNKIIHFKFNKVFFKKNEKILCELTTDIFNEKLIEKFGKSTYFISGMKLNNEVKKLVDLEIIEENKRIIDKAFSDVDLIKEDDTEFKI